EDISFFVRNLWIIPILSITSLNTSTQSEALKQDATELLYRTSLNRLGGIRQAVQDNGEWQGELKQVTKTDRQITVESRWTLVKDEAGEPKFYLVVNTDITEQKQLEAQFLRTQRLESLGTLAGGIAHDLNNILAPILGFSKLLPLKLPDVDEQTKGFFKIMENNANRGTALVKQILTFSRGLEGDKGIVQVRHLINEIAQIINETFPKAIELNVDAPKTLWTVNADVNQLHQVLMNLSVNARDAMPNGGKLTIKAENFTIEREYARLHIDAELGSYLKLTVTDTGVGISPEIIDRIFEPFFTTKEIGRGTGLGLSTVIGIVKSHGGFVEVISDKGRSNLGTQFEVFLPASEAAESNTEETEEDLRGNSELVLVVDDETAMLEVTKATLETYNYRVVTANNGMEAIAAYAQNKDAIDLVIMDIMMPEMDGKTAIRTIKKINADAKVIAVSGLITSQEIIRELDGDVKAFMSKPYTNDDLLRVVGEVVSP
ncbi:MAG: ATP-binding protein, partial [Cyanobacteria bacterium J06588_4]